MSASEYYSDTNTPGTRAIASSLSMRNEFDLIAAGFGKLPDLSGNALKIVSVNAGATGLESITAETVITRLGLPSATNLKLGAANNATTTGSANTYLASITTITALADFLRVSLKINVDNTGASTLKINALATVTIKRLDGSDLQADDLIANRIYEFFYNSTTGFWYLDTYMYDPAANTSTISYSTITTITQNSTTINNEGKAFSNYYRSKEISVDIVTGTATIDLSLSDVFYLDMDADCAVAFTNAPAAGEVQTIMVFVNNQASYTISGFSGTSYDIKKVSGETITSPTASGKDLYIITIIPSANVLLIGQIANWVAV